mmetsp:Transcript_62343/g.201015  ORF Transcript_62343/g.201015 Transcript_62343/m.201015 type:complete len:256 (-) Transcript_62343:535-1302(-)
MVRAGGVRRQPHGDHVPPPARQRRDAHAVAAAAVAQGRPGVRPALHDAEPHGGQPLGRGGLHAVRVRPLVGGDRAAHHRHHEPAHVHRRPPWGARRQLRLDAAGGRGRGAAERHDLARQRLEPQPAAELRGRLRVQRGPGELPPAVLRAAAPGQLLLRARGARPAAATPGLRAAARALGLGHGASAGQPRLVRPSPWGGCPSVHMQGGLQRPEEAPRSPWALRAQGTSIARLQASCAARSGHSRWVRRGAAVRLA